MKLSERNASVILFFAPLLWGIAFSFQSLASDIISPFSFNGIRMFIGFAVLSPFLIVSLKKKGKVYFKKVVRVGLICGLFLTVATAFQHIGIGLTSAGKAGFITSLYVLFVPILSVIRGKKIPVFIWPCIAVALFGAYFLCINGAEGIEKGDYLVFISSFFYAMHIIAVDASSDGVSGFDSSAVQFLTAALINGVLALITGEKVTGAVLRDALIPILYSGVVSSGLAYTIQITCQRYVSPVKATFILSLESAIAAIGGVVILGERMNAKQLFGCVLVFTAVLLSQMNFGNKKTEK